MQETNFDEVENLAKELQSQGKKWHFHMLTPDCVFNKNKGKHAFVFENVSDNKTYVVYSDERNMELGQKLVKMIHGDKILKKEENAIPSKNEKIKKILEKAKNLNERGIHWHHHMLFPNCIFNEHSGKWNIVFEDQETGEKIEVLYDDEPVDDLREIEVLYYAQKK
ncbi:hypothetical protein KY346_06070 [Candidatus Woesearchaeota archaeon]|nr:hypothetical protein [Candidatus Woesearchaeota archaeon]